MSDFVIGSANSNGLYGIFEDCEDTGYLYLSDHEGGGIIDHLHIYDYPKKLGIEEKDVEVVWSNDESKCGVKVWGKLYGVFDLERSKKMACYIQDKNTSPINDPNLLRGF